MRRPMPKFKRVGKKQLGSIAAHKSLARIYGKNRHWFYRVKGNTILAVGGIPFGKPGNHTLAIAKYNSEKKRFQPLAQAHITYFGEQVSIGNIETLPSRQVLGASGFLIPAKQKTGFSLFRLFLNDAIALAKKQGIKEIRIQALNSELRDYYKSFGFEFSRSSMEGRYYLK